ncbi:kinase-like domain-containing protein [Rhizophagus clarus]|uniref:Kinase-like domain-containing protein n=1 Tax=Rhizophagus clarus TaxID=94130 RepID=A0A8H3LJ86_9GLOM|nr:kinase-like domain-containing protein [Rhizophagus clarus]
MTSTPAIRFTRRRRNDENNKQLSSLDKKNDVYSVGVLLWAISSGRPPFYVENELYDIDLAVGISQGLGETIILLNILIFTLIIARL